MHRGYQPTGQIPAPAAGHDLQAPPRLAVTRESHAEPWQMRLEAATPSGQATRRGPQHATPVSCSTGGRWTYNLRPETLQLDEDSQLYGSQNELVANHAGAGCVVGLTSLTGLPPAPFRLLLVPSLEEKPRH